MRERGKAASGERTHDRRDATLVSVRRPDERSTGDVGSSRRTDGRTDVIGRPTVGRTVGRSGYGHGVNLDVFFFYQNSGTRLRKDGSVANYTVCRPGAGVTFRAGLELPAVD